jgi:hypothetical protein
MQSCYFSHQKHLLLNKRLKNRVEQNSNQLAFCYRAQSLLCRRSAWTVKEWSEAGTRAWESGEGTELRELLLSGWNKKEEENQREMKSKVLPCKSFWKFKFHWYCQVCLQHEVKYTLWMWLPLSILYITSTLQNWW